VWGIRVSAGASVRWLQWLAFSGGLAWRRLSGLVSAGSHLCRGFTPEGHCLGAPSYLSSCKISLKLDNSRPSYSYLTN